MKAQVIDKQFPHNHNEVHYLTSTNAQFGVSSGVSIEITHSDRYARFEVLDHPELSVNLWFPHNKLILAVNKLKSILPPSFPTKSVAIKKSAAKIVQEALPVKISKSDLPEGQV